MLANPLDGSSEADSHFSESHIPEPESKTQESDSRPTSKVVFEILTKMFSEQGSLRVHTDISNNTYVSCTIGGKTFSEMPVSGNEFAFLIYAIICQNIGSLAQREVLAQIKAYVRGMALIRCTTPLSSEVVLLRILRDDPRLELVVNHFLSKEMPQYECTWEKYTKELRNFAVSQGFGSLRSSEFAFFPNSLSLWLGAKRPFSNNSASGSRLGSPNPGSAYSGGSSIRPKYRPKYRPTQPTRLRLLPTKRTIETTWRDIWKRSGFLNRKEKDREQ